MYSLLFIVGSSELFLIEFLRDRKRDKPVFFVSMQNQWLTATDFACATSGPNVFSPAFIDVKLIVCSQESRIYGNS